MPPYALKGIVKNTNTQPCLITICGTGSCPPKVGRLPQMLSLPEKQNYPLQGLVYISREQTDAIRQAVPCNFSCSGVGPVQFENVEIENAAG